MALARTYAVALVGVTGHVVEVEADLAAGLPGLAIIGLPDTSLHEARDRVRAAVVNSGEAWPQRRMTLGLSPASLPKGGSAFDLAMAVAVLGAAGTVPLAALVGVVFVGELALDGRVRAVRGVLPAVIAAVRGGIERVVVPAANLAEARLVPDVEAVGVRSLRGLVQRLRGEPFDEDTVPGCDEAPAAGGAGPARVLDLADVLGQSTARRAVEVAAAGGHHLFMSGPPGAGKTMLAERLPGLLPDLDIGAALEVTAVHSVAGTLPPGAPLLTRPPLCAPHHTATVPALVGGGSGLVRPGAASLAHRGVLFLDEAPEFATGVLDALRQPLESGEVTIARAAGTACYPARFLLVLAANPCPCASESGRSDSCTCPASARRRYLGKLSGPLLDRVDLRVTLLPVSRAELMADGVHTESTAVVAARVRVARRRAAVRFGGLPWRTNAEIPGPALRREWAPTPGARRAAERQLERGLLTVRGLDRVLRVAWTLADLGGVARPGPGEVLEALSLRHDVSGTAA